MSEMSDRHAKVAQHLQGRLVTALANGETITADMIRTWLEAVKVERESEVQSLGFDVLPPDDDDLADYTDGQVQDLWQRLGNERRRRHLTRKR